MKDKTKVLNTYGYMFDKLLFTVFPPHQLFLKRMIVIIVENQYVKHSAFLPY